jgi:hypothetical protein
MCVIFTPFFVIAFGRCSHLSFFLLSSSLFRVLMFRALLIQVVLSGRTVCDVCLAYREQLHLVENVRI